MPIMSDGTLQYELPDQYHELLTKEFLERFAHNLGSDFLPEDATALDWNYCEGTFRWYNALCDTIESATEREEEYVAMFKYYEDLPWYDSDLFDSEVTEAAVKAGIIRYEAPEE